MDDVLDFIAGHEDAAQQAVLQHLHTLLMEGTSMEAKLRYKIPFYYGHSWVCYLNPLRGKGGGVELVFLHGQQLSNAQGLLDDKGRRMVRGVTLHHPGEVPPAVLMEMVQEALLLDEL